MNLGLAALRLDAIAAAPATGTPIDAIAAALAAASVVFTPERRERAFQRQSVIAQTSDLQEHELLKRTVQPSRTRSANEA